MDFPKHNEDPNLAGGDPYCSIPPVTDGNTTKPKGLWATLAVVLGGIGLKAKSLLFLFKGLTAFKFLLSSASMFAMVWYESLRYGWAYGVGFVALLFAHGMGHRYALTEAGIESGWPIFIPGFGGFSTMKGRIESVNGEAKLGYYGQLFGTGAALAFAAFGVATGSRLGMSLAYLGFFINLFNLIPIVPLDGGRMSLAFTKHAWMIGFFALLGLFIVTQSPQLILIGVIGAFSLLRRSKMSEEQLDSTDAERIQWAMRYFGLITFSTAAMYFTHRLMTP